jgi:hypothetical protein
MMPLIYLIHRLSIHAKYTTTINYNVSTDPQSFLTKGALYR